MRASPLRSRAFHLLNRIYPQPILHPLSNRKGANATSFVKYFSTSHNYLISNYIKPRKLKKLHISSLREILCMFVHFKGLMHFMCHKRGCSDPKKLFLSLIFSHLLNMSPKTGQTCITARFYKKIKSLIGSFIPKPLCQTACLLERRTTSRNSLFSLILRTPL